MILLSEVESQGERVTKTLDGSVEKAGISKIGQADLTLLEFIVTDERIRTGFSTGQ